MAAANVNYPILNNDPLADMKVRMARALRDVVGLDQISNQCQYFCRYAGASIMVPALTANVSQERINTIIAEFNRTYGRRDILLIIGVNEQLNLEAFVYKFHELQFQNVDLTTFDPRTLDIPTLERAKANLQRAKATIAAHSTSPQTMKTPYEEGRGFLLWVAEVKRVAASRVGQFLQPIDYLLDPNIRAPRGTKFDLDNAELYNIIVPSFTTSSDTSTLRIILPYQADANGSGLFRHVQQLNQGEAGLNRALKDLKKDTVDCSYTGTSRQVLAVKYCQDWETYRLFYEHEGNKLNESEWINMFYDNVQVPDANIKFWGEFGQARRARGATFAGFLREFQLLVTYHKVEKDAGSTASYKVAKVTPTKSDIPGIPSAPETSDIPGIPGGPQRVTTSLLTKRCKSSSLNYHHTSRTVTGRSTRRASIGPRSTRRALILLKPFA